jgi:hypothetical protein
MSDFRPSLTAEQQKIPEKNPFFRDFLFDQRNTKTCSTGDYY